MEATCARKLKPSATNLLPLAFQVLRESHHRLKGFGLDEDGAGHAQLMQDFHPVGIRRMAKVFACLFTVNRPKLINARRETLAHHLPAHSPIRIGRYTGQTHRAPAPLSIDSIQNAHHFRCRFRLRDRKEIFFGVLAFLA